MFTSLREKEHRSLTNGMVVSPRNNGRNQKILATFESQKSVDGQAYQVYKHTGSYQLIYSFDLIPTAYLDRSNFFLAEVHFLKQNDVLVLITPILMQLKFWNFF